MKRVIFKGRGTKVNCFEPPSVQSRRDASYSLVKTLLTRYGTDVPREGQAATKHDTDAFAIC